VLLEIGRQVLILPPVRAQNPDLFAAQGFPQRLRGTAVDDGRYAWSWAGRGPQTD